MIMIKKEIRRSRLLDLTLALEAILKKEFDKDMYIEYIDRYQGNQVIAVGIVGEDDSMVIDIKYCNTGILVIVNGNDYVLNYAKEE